MQILYCIDNQLIGAWILKALEEPTREILTIKGVADFLQVNERTIYRLAAAKKIPAFKVGGAWRFRKSDLDAWIALQSAHAQDQTT